MNASDIITDDMTLEEKLLTIENLMKSNKLREDINRRLGRPFDTPVDPSEATICEGCE